MAAAETIEYAHETRRRDGHRGIGALRMWTILNVCAIAADALIVLCYVFVAGPPRDAIGQAVLTVVLVCSVIGIAFMGVVQIVLTLCFLRRASTLDLLVLVADAASIIGLLVLCKSAFA